MVATEERKIESRKKAAREQEAADKANNKHGNVQAKGKENKDRIVSESKSAGKVDYKEAEETEAKNQQRQREKETDARKDATQDDVQVKDRGKY